METTQHPDTLAGLIFEATGPQALLAPGALFVFKEE
jgi:hypothetical protein